MCLVIMNIKPCYYLFSSSWSYVSWYSQMSYWMLFISASKYHLGSWFSLSEKEYHDVKV